MRGILLLSPFLLCGCFKYVPLEGPSNAVERGTELRAYFIEGQSIDLHDVTAHNITAMDVEFVRQEGSELVLSAFYLDSSSREAGYLGNGWTVRVPVESVSHIEVKKLDIWRTVGLGALGVLGSVFAWEAIAGGRGSEDAPPDEGGPIR